MISPIEGQKSNFKICILRVFILVIMPFIRNVVYSVDQFMFLVSLLFIFLKQERCKAHFIVFWLKDLWGIAVPRKTISSPNLFCPPPSKKNPFTSQTTSKNTFFSSFLLTALLKLEDVSEGFHCHCFLFPNSHLALKGLFPLFLDEHCWKLERTWPHGRDNAIYKIALSTSSISPWLWAPCPVGVW